MISAVKDRAAWHCGDSSCTLCGGSTDHDDYTEDDFDDEADSHSELGQTLHPPERLKGYSPNEYETAGKSVGDFWPLLANTKTYDILGRAADFWLLNAVSYNVFAPGDADKFLSLIVKDGREQLDALIEDFDAVLRQYCYMAIGGELRHHRAIGQKVLDGNRHLAWLGWKKIVDEVGPDCLLDAAHLFYEMAGGVGGKPWAKAAEILHQREMNILTPELFVDRALDLQHHNGCFMNKVLWKKHTTTTDKTGVKEWGIETIKDVIGPAHAATDTDWGSLKAFGRPEAKKLFDEYRKQVNELRRSSDQPALPAVKTRVMYGGYEY